MKWRRRKTLRHRAAPLALVPLLLGAASAPPPRLAVPLPGHSDQAALAYADAAAAVRRKDCPAAYKALQPILAGKGQEARFAQLLLGFYSHSCEQVAYAEDRLFAAANPDSPLEDWRLYILSDAAAARGHVLLAQTSLARLLGRLSRLGAAASRPGQGGEPRLQRGDASRALEMVRAARSEELSGDEAAQLEALAWEIGGKTGDTRVQAEAARRLLVSFPLRASELKVAEMFREPGGTLDLSRILDGGPAEAARSNPARPQAGAERALHPGRCRRPAAISTGCCSKPRPSPVPTAAARRSSSSPAATSADPRQQSAIAWALAQARRGSRHGSARARQPGRRRPPDPAPVLAEVPRTGVPARLRSGPRGPGPEAALRRLPGPGALRPRHRRAAAAAPHRSAGDSTGANNLWQLGWREYGKKNYTAAWATGPSSSPSIPRTPAPAAAATGRRGPSTPSAKRSGHSRSTPRSPRPTPTTSTAGTPSPAFTAAPRRRRSPPRRSFVKTRGPSSRASTGRGCSPISGWTTSPCPRASWCGRRCSRARCALWRR